MRTGGMAGLADVTDHVAGIHRIAGAQVYNKPGKMRIARKIISSVPNVDDVAIAIPPPDEFDTPLSDRHHRSPGRRSVIDGQMRPHLAKDRVHAVAAERRRNSCVAERRAQE